MKQIIILFLLLYNLGFSQESAGVFVTYQQKIVVDETKFTTIINSYLISNGNESLYEEDFSKSSILNKSDDDASKIFTIAAETNPLFYKNSENLITYSDFINSSSDFYVTDKIEFDWTITDVTKEILGYKCQQAKTDFRGRSYIAYFTSKIPFNAGPWKFHCLPGLILEIKAIDGAFEAFAKKIELKNTSMAVKEPYTKEKKITFNEFKILYKKKYNEAMGYRPEGETTMYMPKKRIETLILF